jgi:hypothetical protein
MRLIDEPAECEVLRINDQVALNIGPAEQVVWIELLDASRVLTGLTGRSVQLANLLAGCELDCRIAAVSLEWSVREATKWKTFWSCVVTSSNNVIPRRSPC